MESSVSISLANLQPETIALLAEIDAFTALLARHGTMVKGYSESAVRHYDQLPFARRREIHSHFHSYAAICANAESENIELRDIVGFASSALRHFGLVAPPGFFETLGSEDIIEVYDTEGLQLFRNFVLYEHCSYTLLELISYAWFELLERHASVTEAILDHIRRVLSEGSEPIPSTVGPHNMREVFSEERRMFVSEFKMFAPLFAGAGVRKGFICSGTLRQLGDQEGVTILKGRA